MNGWPIKDATTYRTGHTGLKRYIRLLVLFLPILIAVGAWNSQPAVAIGALKQNARLLVVHFIDVGQADSILIQMPDGETALIDGGNNDGLAVAYLQRIGITHIDVLIASHPHADHIGGLSEVMNTFSVAQVWTSGASLWGLHNTSDLIFPHGEL
jgi:competence protein ComEC